jgi:hypothetical protein
MAEGGWFGLRVQCSSTYLQLLFALSFCRPRIGPPPHPLKGIAHDDIHGDL